MGAAVSTAASLSRNSLSRSSRRRLSIMTNSRRTHLHSNLPILRRAAWCSASTVLRSLMRRSRIVRSAAPDDKNKLQR